VDGWKIDMPVARDVVSQAGTELDGFDDVATAISTAIEEAQGATLGKTAAAVADMAQNPFLMQLTLARSMAATSIQKTGAALDAYEAGDQEMAIENSRGASQ
jgi:hypothetical protein